MTAQEPSRHASQGTCARPAGTIGEKALGDTRTLCVNPATDRKFLVRPSMMITGSVSGSSTYLAADTGPAPASFVSVL